MSQRLASSSSMMENSKSLSKESLEGLSQLSQQSQPLEQSSSNLPLDNANMPAPNTQSPTPPLPTTKPKSLMDCTSVFANVSSTHNPLEVVSPVNVYKVSCVSINNKKRK